VFVVIWSRLARWVAVNLAVTEDAMPILMARSGKRPDIPDSVVKNLERNYWIIVPTWSRKTKGKRAGTKSVGAQKVFKSG
jgi:hypothetical protein